MRRILPEIRRQMWIIPLILTMLFTACPERQSDPATASPADAQLTPSADTIPQATAALWANLSVAVPPGHAGKQLIAGVRHSGRLLAIAHTIVPQEGTATLDLRAFDDWSQKPEEPVSLLLVINEDTYAWPAPSYGDLYLEQSVQLPEIGTPLVIPDVGQWQKKTPTAKENIVTVHYHRFDGQYLEAGLWTWDPFEKRTPADNDLLPVGQDAFGLVFQLDRGLYGDGADTPRIGLLPRLAEDWNRKDGVDRFLTPDHGKEIYLIGGRQTLYTEAPDITPHINAVFFDSATKIEIELTHPTDSVPEGIQILRDASDPVPFSGAQLADRTRIVVETSERLDIDTHSYEAVIPSLGRPVKGVPRGMLDDREAFYSPDARLGIEFSQEQTVFRVFAPTASKASVVIYDAATGDAGRKVESMHKTGRGIWEFTASGNMEGRFYNYIFEGPGLDPTTEVVDIYAINTVDSTRRARITDLEKTNPPGWRSDQRGPEVKSPVDIVVFEMHVRDFTIAENSGVENKGLYTGFAEPGTRLTLDPSVATGLDHLVELGVTHVQLLPVQDFQNEEAANRYNWGYITNAFNSPEGMFASNIHDESRIRELKVLIKALHDRGIGVILDVVYNHTGEGAFFNATVPEYYYRMMPDGTYANGSGCGNEFRSEAPMARKYIIDSLRFWVEEYGVDGFRFDLMALLDIETMRQAETELRKVRPDIILYGEPWQAGGSPLKEQTDKNTIRGTGIGAFNDEFRNALKGSPDGEGQGFIQRGFERGAVEKGMEGSHQTWAANPAQTINYMTCHDNLVLYDKLQISRTDASEQDIIGMMKLGYFVLFTAQGVPFFHGGEEFARTKFGDHNSYEAPDSVNQVDWALKKQNRELNDYVRKLIALRKAHPLFRLRTAEEISKRVQFHHAPTGDTILATIDGRDLPGETWKRVCLLINGGEDVREFTLPEGRWQVAFNLDGEEQNVPFDGKIKMQRKSAVLLREP